MGRKQPRDISTQTTPPPSFQCGSHVLLSCRRLARGRTSAGNGGSGTLARGDTCRKNERSELLKRYFISMTYALYRTEPCALCDMVSGEKGFSSLRPAASDSRHPLGPAPGR
ncbi:hypothetical protein AAFF_G00300440 [Aldrovandia affinis]|uniref:Uncharacterized protein n=1 Tax=Aldrovandia affinis TaxID=143900 RepID=A0AAD7WRL8_9TELE|nr:hypothetical protein AAFF_G00300440 [Aldrovandia affinis]